MNIRQILNRIRQEREALSRVRKQAKLMPDTANKQARLIEVRIASLERSIADAV